MLHSGKKNKYGARKVRTEDGTFDSELEYGRWQTLKLMQRSGLIRDLERQIPFELEVNGVRIGRYTLDHRYFDVETGEIVYEEVKGFVARDFPLQRKLLLALFNINLTVWPVKKRKSNRRAAKKGKK